MLLLIVGTSACSGDDSTINFDRFVSFAVLVLCSLTALFRLEVTCSCCSEDVPTFVASWAAVVGAAETDSLDSASLLEEAWLWLVEGSIVTLNYDEGGSTIERRGVAFSIYHDFVLVN